MPRSCTVCEHPERGVIDASLVGGASNRSVASLYDVSEAAVRRHKANHLPAKLVMAQAAEEVAQADGLLDQVQDLQARTLAILEAAEATSEHRTALGAIREARSNLELLAKLLGKRGVFYEEWTSEAGAGWERYEVPAAECPRIPEEFLEEERATLPSWVYRQEYECSFEETEDQVFTTEMVERAVTPEVTPLFGTGG